MITLLKKILLSLLFLLGSIFCLEAEASGTDVYWPDPGIQLTAQGVAVIDADTHTLLYGKNHNEQYYPASITKIMTALVVLENSSLDETVTVSEEALRLESGAVTCGLSAGDTISVRDLLYATLLRSANDAAAALAIHVGGSIDGFATMMNEKAIELGCTHTNFTNPHGLPDSSHLTTAYDMALIMAECVNNEDFLAIESHDSYTIAGTIRNPGGFTVTMGHRMLRSGTQYSDDRVIAGKTGYTTSAGNTLVTCATSGERRVIVALLDGKNPYNYENTSSLIDFGLDNFSNVTLTDTLERFGTADRLALDHIAEGMATSLMIEEDPLITVPYGYAEDSLSADYEYNLPHQAPELAVAIMEVMYAGRKVGTTYVLDDRQSLVSVEEVSDVVDVPQAVRTVSLVLILGVAGSFGSALILSEIRTRRERAKKERLRKLRRRRERRFMEMGVYPSDLRMHETKRYSTRRRRTKPRKLNGREKSADSSQWGYNWRR